MAYPGIFCKGAEGECRNLTILIPPIPFVIGNIGIGYWYWSSPSQKWNFKNFERPITDSDSSTSKAFDQTL